MACAPRISDPSGISAWPVEGVGTSERGEYGDYGKSAVHTACPPVDALRHQRPGVLDASRHWVIAEARGWDFAEVTAGGVPLAEIDHRTMQSRLVPGLHLVGAMLDCDGRIGGFNFQWAWSTGP